MTKKYSEEFKKQMVQEYLKGTSYPKLSKEYQVAKSTLFLWVSGLKLHIYIVLYVVFLLDI